MGMLERNRRKYVAVTISFSLDSMVSDTQGDTRCSKIVCCPKYAKCVAFFKEEFEDIKWEIRIRKSKADNTMAK
jgi:hypothetical protein